MKEHIEGLILKANDAEEQKMRRIREVERNKREREELETRVDDGE